MTFFLLCVAVFAVSLAAGYFGMSLLRWLGRRSQPPPPLPDPDLLWAEWEMAKAAGPAGIRALADRYPYGLFNQHDHDIRPDLAAFRPADEDDECQQ